MKFLKIIALVVLLVGCQSLQQFDKEANYKMSLPITVNGDLVVGGGSVPFSKNYAISIRNHKKIDYLHVSTCARSIDIEGPYFKRKVMKNYKEYQFVFTPQDYEKFCPMEFIIGDKKGENKIGTILFEEDGQNLHAEMFCNGRVVVHAGKSFCQSKVGLFQKISFKEDVMLATDEACPLTGKGRVWKYEMPKGNTECVFINREGLFFSLHNYGWNRILLEKE